MANVQGVAHIYGIRAGETTTSVLATGTISNIDFGSEWDQENEIKDADGTIIEKRACGLKKTLSITTQLRSGGVLEDPSLQKVTITGSDPAINGDYQLMGNSLTETSGEVVTAVLELEQYENISIT